MGRRTWLAGMMLALLWAAPARAQNGVIVRTTLGVPGLQLLCLAQNCTVVGALDGALNQVFLLTTPLNPQTLVNTLILLPGIVNAEADQVLSLIGAVNLVPSPIPTALMSDRTLIPYPANSATMVWNSYATQPAAGVVEVQNAQSQFHVTGTGIVADIDTGVDPNHQALQGVLLQGYDFTRNQVGGSEMTDLSPPFTQPNPCDSATCPTPVQVNQSSAAILDQSSAAILDTNTQYTAFGHGTMVMGVIHLVAPTAQLLPLKAFQSDGTADLSNILRAIYYGVQNNASVINMSFDTKTASTELKNALDYASRRGVVSVASAGNDGMQETVYPAALQNDVMGVASVGSTTASDGARSTFSNFGDAIVWVAAPGEEIVTTYPFSTYAAGWGTSFSAPFVSGAAALARSLKSAITECEAAAAVAQAAPLSDAGMGHGRLDLVLALQSLSGVSGSPDFTVAAAPATAVVLTGGSAIYTVTASPANGFSQIVLRNCTGAPTRAACSVSPATVALDSTHSATATVTLMTMARAWSPPLPSPQSRPPILPWLSALACCAFLAAFLLCSALRHALRERYDFAETAFLLTASFCAYACGGGYGGGQDGGQESITLSSATLNPTGRTFSVEHL
jgi:subtilisin family serine protease